ncbi:hypothetical protein QAD02_000742 [Eretmocerus hayati]|uniref:Uncharacterized protein n=1 Tax=Eretmocerus hayati TaxID=131215 RepID=A0ACC2NFB4_9HYME|nr:hypothetical protein QAD02_000742 [Eretmocerus hayati]
MKATKEAKYKKVSGEDIHNASIVFLPPDSTLNLKGNTFSCSAGVEITLNENISEEFLDLSEMTEMTAAKKYSLNPASAEQDDELAYDFGSYITDSDTSISDVSDAYDSE